MLTKPLIIVQIRFNSKRLLGKALYPLNGMPMFIYLLRRLKVLSSRFKIIVATTKNKTDDLIAVWAGAEEIDAVRGEEDDVILRYIQCIEKFPSNIIVRVTGDNPLTDPFIIEKAIELMRDEYCDYVRAIDEYALGVGVDVFRDTLIKTIHKNSVSKYEREHIDAYVLNNQERFKIAKLKAPPGLNYPDISLTVDTHKDYMNIAKIIESYPSDAFIESKDAVNRARQGNI